MSKREQVDKLTAEFVAGCNPWVCLLGIILITACIVLCAYASMQVPVK